MQQLIVTEADNGKRIDFFISQNAPDQISRARVQTLIKQGEVKLNKKAPRGASTKIATGDIIDFSMPAPIPLEVKSENIKLNILYEDKHLIVLNKQAGMVVHPAPGNWQGTLVNALLYHCKNTLSGIGGVMRPGIVHRLDKDTSGLMVVAKSYQAHLHLQQQFAEHKETLIRKYQALIWGVPLKKKSTIKTLLGKNKYDRLKQMVVENENKNTKLAVTNYQIVKIFENEKISLIECQLETGRTHQIRVHLAHIGHPILADKTYGNHFASKARNLNEQAQSLLANIKGQILHSCQLQFIHPSTNETMQFTCPLPKEITELINAFN